jgi:hypothetical protein
MEWSFIEESEVETDSSVYRERVRLPWGKYGRRGEKDSSSFKRRTCFTFLLGMTTQSSPN